MSSLSIDSESWPGLGEGVTSMTSILLEIGVLGLFSSSFWGYGLAFFFFFRMLFKSIIGLFYGYMEAEIY